MSDDRSEKMKEVVRLARAYAHLRGKPEPGGGIRAVLKTGWRNWSFIDSATRDYLVVYRHAETIGFANSTAKCMLVARKLGIHHYDPEIEGHLDYLKQALVLEMLADV